MKLNHLFGSDSIKIKSDSVIVAVLIFLLFAVFGGKQNCDCSSFNPFLATTGNNKCPLSRGNHGSSHLGDIWTRQHTTINVIIILPGFGKNIYFCLHQIKVFNRRNEKMLNIFTLNNTNSVKSCGKVKDMNAMTKVDL